MVRPIDGLDLEVAGGELALLLGASGCGKTTLLSILAGDPHADTRERACSTASRSTALSGRDADRSTGGGSVGVVFQAFNLIPSLTAAENVQVPLRAAGPARARGPRRGPTELLSRVGLSARRTPPARRAVRRRAAARRDRARAGARSAPAARRRAHRAPRLHPGRGRAAAAAGARGRGPDRGRRDARRADAAARRPRRGDEPAPAGAGPPADRAGGGRGRGRSSRRATRRTSSTSSRRARWSWCAAAPTAARRCSRATAQGEYFGELGPMFGLPRSASARAAAPTRLQGLPLREFRKRFGPEAEGVELPERERPLRGVAARAFQGGGGSHGEM